MWLEENARIDDLDYKGLKIIQNKNEFCFGMDSILLSDFAKNIKKSRQQPGNSETERQYSGPGAPKRPHTRRGHWHHYWVGSDKDNSRKLILKWTAPMFIGGGSDDTIATVNKIE